MQHFQSDDSVGAVLFRNAIADFEAAHPNVSVRQETTTHDEYITLFNVEAASGELPDVFMILAANIDSTQAAGLLADLGPDFAADVDWLNAQNPGAMLEWTRGDSIYAIPTQMIVTHLIYYNQAIFDEVGIEEFPTTWEDFKSAITTLNDAGYIPIALGNKERWVVADPLFGTMIFRATGLDWFNNLLTGDAKFTDPEFVYAVEAFKELVDIGAFNVDANSLTNAQQRTLYYNGEAAMFIEGNWAIGSVAQEAPEDIRDNTHLAIWPPLTAGKGSANQVTGGAGWGIAINSKVSGAKREAAVELLKTLSAIDYGRQRIEAGLMAGQVVTDFDETLLPALTTELNRKLATEWEVVPIFTNWTPRGILDTLGQTMQELMIGQKTPEQVAQELQAEMDRSIIE